jgi:hypothetical protein
VAWRQLSGREIYVRQLGAWLAGWLVALLQVAVVAALIAACHSQAQTPPPQSVEEALHRMSDRAAVVFAGQVMAVHRVAGVGSASGVVEVEFHIDQAVRGCTTGGTYVLREWAGRWAVNDARFHVGQRRLMLLHAPNAAGISSPVDGMDGALPIRGVGSAVRSDNDSAATIASPAAEMVDLRWVGAKLARPVVYRNEPASGSSQLAATANAVVPMGLSSAPVSAATTPAQTAAVGAVVGMLRAWGLPPASVGGDANHIAVSSDVR